MSTVRTTTATGFTAFHTAADPSGFGEWLNRLLSCARDADGFVTARESVRDTPQFDWALAVTFHTEDLLHQWLDSAERLAVLRDGRALGYWQRTPDLVVVDGESPPEGIGVFGYTVAAGKDAEFHAAQATIATRTARFSGFEGTAVFPPDASGEWMSVVRFRRTHQLSKWIRSQERVEALRPVTVNLTRDFSAVTAPFGSTVRTDNGRTTVTPYWKSAMLVLLVLYPTVMLLTRFFVPVLADLGSPPWLSMWLGQVASVAALQWLLVPLASRGLRHWLDPVDGARLPISLAGAVLVISLYGATLLLFATVPELQYWDYGS
ncbi:MAG: antibiotic biosynthesis monooxygenase [Actinomycetia bacterium]|nr:antibiotic biosynthesis monooxygenase [Actinomycetes bacterium]